MGSRCRMGARILIEGTQIYLQTRGGSGDVGHTRVHAHSLKVEKGSCVAHIE